jgi:hypothetical protein
LAVRRPGYASGVSDERRPWHRTLGLTRSVADGPILPLPVLLAVLVVGTLLIVVLLIFDRSLTSGHRWLLAALTLLADSAGFLLHRYWRRKR